jgi:hypothetical protein
MKMSMKRYGRGCSSSFQCVSITLHEETEENTINASIAQPMLDQGLDCTAAQSWYIIIYRCSHHSVVTFSGVSTESSYSAWQHGNAIGRTVASSVKLHN